MGNRQRFAFGVVVTGICIALAGCGGGVSKSEHNALQAELDAAKSDLAQAESARQTAQAAQQTAETALAQAQAAQQTTAQELAQAQEEASTREANQRAERLKVAFGTPSSNRRTTTSPVTVEAIRACCLTLTHGGFRTATLSGNGIRAATMPLTSGGDSGKTVVYTDRELTRPLLEHYGNHRDTAIGGDKTRFNLAAPSGGPLELASSVNLLDSDRWTITHGRAASVAGTGFVREQRDSNGNITNAGTAGTLPTGDALPVNARAATASSYPGLLHGKSGRFECGGDGCEVTITPAYDGTELTVTNNQASLSSVSVAATGTDAILYFKPSGSPALQLYDGDPFDIGADTEYMVFGYWREDPTSPAADYQVRAFAQVLNTAARTVDTSFTATYDGTAVGMYVEQDPNNPVDTHKQGEFTADVYLEASGSTTISGTIDDFVTTPTGGSAEPRTAGRWLVRLLGAAADPAVYPGVGTGTTALIDNLSGVKSGTWDYAFVPAHQHADTDLDTTGVQRTPPAVTGTFDTRIVDFVHLIGAYGAKAR